MNLKGRSFLTLKDFTPDEIEYLIDLAAELKAKKKQGITGNSLKGKNIALIFEKPSTRTRCAFAVACNDEGGYHEYLGKKEIQLGGKESVEDTARVLGRMFDGIEYRGFSHKNVGIAGKVFRRTRMERPDRRIPSDTDFSRFSYIKRAFWLFKRAEFCICW